jgi:hypothetical protein
VKLKKMIAGHLLVLGLFLPQVVSAEDFTFNVGVDLKNLHEDVSLVRVYCTAQRRNQQGFLGLGQAGEDLTVPANGTINTTVQIKFNANSGVNPADVDNYNCTLLFYTASNDIGTPVVATSPTCSNSVNAWKCVKPGTPFSGKSFTGPIP